jgi:hypothetical protein
VGVVVVGLLAIVVSHEALSVSAAAVQKPDLLRAIGDGNLDPFAALDADAPPGKRSQSGTASRRS